MVIRADVQKAGVREYYAPKCATFRKTDEPFGGLSNMAAGFPLYVNDVRIGTSEVLYQISRFPHMPDVQWMLVGQSSPMSAKMKSKPYRAQSRTDWEAIKVRVMRWCLRVKLAQNWQEFGGLLESTGNRDIVEVSMKDPYWGATPQDFDENMLIGANVLGRLLMELREKLRASRPTELQTVSPPEISNFLFFERPAGIIRHQ